MIFACDICNEVFSEEPNFMIHSRTHMKEKPFACDICGKTFSYKSTLEAHLRTHSVEKPFLCGVCNKAFSWKRCLEEHMRTHTKERPYACDVCHKAFYRKSSLVTHLKTRAKEKPFACDVCNKALCNKSTLIAHLRPYSPKNGQPLGSGEPFFYCFNDTSRFAIHQCSKTGLDLPEKAKAAGQKIAYFFQGSQTLTFFRKKKRIIIGSITSHDYTNM